MDESQLSSIIKRLERLEKAVIRDRNQERPIKPDDFAGLKGGINLLISRGFFRTKKHLSSTKQELEKHDYHYSAAAIQTTLNRLSKRAGSLATFREGGKKVYVKRK